ACAADFNPCTDDVCNANGTCTHVPNTNACDDFNPCTNGDVCAGGTCTAGSPVPAGQPCFDDGNTCTDDVCNETGACTHVGTTNPCDDGNACSTGDVCTGGACVPTGLAPECAGTIDLTGAWTLSGPYIDQTTFAGTRRDFDQTGAVLRTTVPGGSAGIGAVNPATGAFTTHTPVLVPVFFGSCYGDESITGSAPSGNVFTGTATLTCAGFTYV